MSVVGLAREIERLRRKIAEKKITADDLAGGSFTLTNPGREGNLFGFAIINQPQVGILRMGEIKKRPVVVEADGEDTIAIRTMMYLALSYDHRVIDGVLGNRFLYRAARILEEADFELYSARRAPHRCRFPVEVILRTLFYGHGSGVGRGPRGG
jgi:2-oxoglutarate dehydrogenase E2 component (dihydrolipoamide succinyltransferase)